MRKKKPVVINTPEDYATIAWLNAEHTFLHGLGEPAGTPDVEPHPNETASDG